MRRSAVSQRESSEARNTAIGDIVGLADPAERRLRHGVLVEDVPFVRFGLWLTTAAMGFSAFRNDFE